MGVRKKKYLADPDLSRKFDFDKRKCVHLRLLNETKTELKIMAYRMQLTVQDMFERLTQAIIDQDPYIVTMLNEYRNDKENQVTDKLFSTSDTESILKDIEKTTPFGK